MIIKSSVKIRVHPWFQIKSVYYKSIKIIWRVLKNLFLVHPLFRKHRKNKKMLPRKSASQDVFRTAHFFFFQKVG